MARPTIKKPWIVETEEVWVEGVSYRMIATRYPEEPERPIDVQIMMTEPFAFQVMGSDLSQMWDGLMNGSIPESTNEEPTA